MHAVDLDPVDLTPLAFLPFHPETQCVLRVFGAAEFTDRAHEMAMVTLASRFGLGERVFDEFAGADDRFAAPALPDVLPGGPAGAPADDTPGPAARLPGAAPPPADEQEQAHASVATPIATPTADATPATDPRVVSGRIVSFLPGRALTPREWRTVAVAATVAYKMGRLHALVRTPFALHLTDIAALFPQTTILQSVEFSSCSSWPYL
jgi:hypothetical protein